MTFGIKKGTLVALIGTIAFGSYQFGKFSSPINDYLIEKFPSHMRSDFENEFGATLDGWEDDIESNSHFVSDIIDVLHYEQLALPFDVKSVRVEPTSKWFQSKDWRDIRMRTPTLIGAYKDEKVFLLSGEDKGTIHHEFKHDKISMLAETNPEFFAEWVQFSYDENHKLLYYSVEAEGFELSILPRCRTDLECQELGFVQMNARERIREDMAYLSELAEVNPESFIGWLYDTPNPRIIGKVGVAQKYGLIPSDFTEYVGLKKRLIEVYGEADISVLNLEKGEEFLVESQEFLDENPNTLYTSKVHYERAVFLQTLFPNFAQKGHVDEFLEIELELLAVLEASYRDTSSYSNTLNDLSNIYAAVGNKELSDLYSDANVLFWDRFDDANPMFATIGVKDFLTKNKPYQPIFF